MKAFILLHKRAVLSVLCGALAVVGLLAVISHVRHCHRTSVDFKTGDQLMQDQKLPEYLK